MAYRIAAIPTTLTTPFLGVVCHSGVKLIAMINLTTTFKDYLHQFQRYERRREMQKMRGFEVVTKITQGD